MGWNPLSQKDRSLLNIVLLNARLQFAICCESIAVPKLGCLNRLGKILGVPDGTPNLCSV
ncbi:MAG: hypothetical protein EAZ60_14660 [Oscillatoriales cyanobacterium]|nr:MAG: hypothetical protein EAZ79_22115 [Oscillatoriales cyanobacterium]TAF22208.1 MAG: hypothetical protein EAZ73_06500 [Oscillatoriales cyanobacterium]TAF36806.1 MAG: hypothetical protein EAZ69_08820 [Oscillatoriales cyanobacterium]TAF55055.1 MAG: hypothetical protein EAZ60_14660 [Oscillatoriales cyanobacterium]